MDSTPESGTLSDIAPGDIARDTRPEPVDGRPGRFRCVIPDAWRVMYAFGGTTMATALRAIEVAVGRDDLRLVSANGTFCQAVPTGPVVIDVEVLRSGRNGAQALARLWASEDVDGPTRSDLVVTAVLGADRPWPVDVTGAQFPLDAVGPDEASLRGAPPDDGEFPKVPYHDQTDWRLAVGRNTWADRAPAGEEPRSVSWFRFNNPPIRTDGTWEPATIAVPADILGPAVFEAGGRPAGFFFVITLQMSVQFFSPMRGEWLCQHTRATHVGDGFATGVAELWTEDRELVALATQAAMLQPIKPG